MRISEMILREDFYTILQDTIIDYYKEVLGTDALFSYDKGEGTRLIINSRLGFICPTPAPKGLRVFLLSEYNIRGNIIKYVTGKLVAYLISAFPRIGAVRTCYITDGLVKNNFFIYPQNRTIRFFDYNSMIVDCITKSGFTDRYFKNQLEFRKKYSYDFMLPLLEYGEKWFREPIMQGHPLARVKEAQKYSKGIEDALAGIKRLANDTYKEVNAAGYIQELKSQIIWKVQQAIVAKNVTCQSLIYDLIDSVVDLKEEKFVVPVCVGHGDFQNGNIWVDDNGKTWIYDWETVGQRSVWYDIAVLKYSLRREHGWKQFVEENNLTDILLCDRREDYIAEQYIFIKGIVLLEDLLFYLDDMIELPLNWGTDIFERNIKNIFKSIIRRN